MDIQYLGQNTFIFELNEHVIITDPALSANPLASNIKIPNIKIDYILLTHAHGDHCADVVKTAKANNATIISNYEIGTYYGEQGLKFHPMNHGGKWKFEFGTIAMVNAVHSSVFPDGSNGGNPCGFVMMTKDKCIYIAGDTALTMDMKVIPILYPKLDLSILPIGDNFTMGIEEAVEAANFVQCKKVIGCHFDSFPYIEINHDEAIQKFSDRGLELTLLELGEKISI